MTDRVIKAIFAAGGVAVGTVVTFLARGRKIKKVVAEGQKLIATAEANHHHEVQVSGKLRAELAELRGSDPKHTPVEEQAQSS